MVRRKDRATFLGRLGQSEAEPPSSVTLEDIARLAWSEELSFEDVKTLIRGVRYGNGYDEKFEYANSWCPKRPAFYAPMSCVHSRARTCQRRMLPRSLSAMRRSITD